MLNLAMAGRLSDSDNGLDALPQQVAGMLAAADDVTSVVAEHQGKRRFIAAGWGANRANAYEVAMKIKETSRADGEGFQIEQLLHGPFCALDSDCLLTLIAPDGNDRGRAGMGADQPARHGVSGCRRRFPIGRAAQLPAWPTARP